MVARRYGLYLFDDRLIEDLKNPYRRAILMKAITLKTETQLMFEAGVKVIQRLSEAIRNWLDIGFMSVIKAIPVFNRDAANAKRNIQSLYGTNWQQYKRKDGKQVLTIGGVQLRVAGEVDDSHYRIAGNWKEDTDGE